MQDVKLARTQSLLKEILPSALANLSDTRLNALNVVDVRCICTVNTLLKCF